MRTENHHQQQTKSNYAVVHTLSNSSTSEMKCSATFSLQQALHKLKKKFYFSPRLRKRCNIFVFAQPGHFSFNLFCKSSLPWLSLCSSRILRDGVRLRDEPKRSLRKSYTTFPVFLFASVEERSSKNRERAIGKTSFSKHVNISSQNHVRCCLQKFDLVLLILPTTTIGNTWNSIRRIWMLIMYVPFGLQVSQHRTECFLCTVFTVTVGLKMHRDVI